MKKLVIVFAFALFATFTYASYTVIKTSNVVTEKFDDDPKKEKKKEAKSEDKKECTKSEKKACCKKDESKSCSEKK